ncbi:hypothetical protein R3X27_03575 [Tropicimonas sp. TH_r6]|uniref:tyrosine-type recombinase/integrase n=1 Tax=Tropicimonas sp. TH_r6 TaxID=3082085 RepID=UPI0029556BD7|nr:tyrosine-type recombinase/integrase [Tropicimonas sp. TH_r6]MDV7141756.1 hypothetical protein [Tropicimonas sp. TH_r6]
MNENTNIQNLRDIKDHIPQVYSAASAKSLGSAFDRVVRLTGKHLHQIPANRVAWSHAAKKIVWAGEFGKGKPPEAQERAFHTWEKKIGATIDKVLETVCEQDVALDADASYDKIIDYVAGLETPGGQVSDGFFPNQATRSIDNLKSRTGIVPSWELDTETATKVIKGTPADKVASLRRSFLFFNKIILARDVHEPIKDLLPEKPIGPLPRIRDFPLDWSKFSPEFLKSRDKAIKRAIRGEVKKDRFAGRLGKDPMARRRAATRGRKKPVRKPEAARKNHILALSWLVRHAFPDREDAYCLQELGELLTVENVETAVEAFRARCQESEFLMEVRDTSSMNTYLCNLSTIAGRNWLPEEILWELEEQRYDPDNYSDRSDEMSATREAFVKLMERDPEIARTIVCGPERLLGEWERAFAKWKSLSVHPRTEALHLLAGASMLGLALARPMRPLNIHEITNDGQNGELIAPKNERVSAWLDIGRDRVKNRRPIEGPIPDWLWNVISVWLDLGRDLWIRRFVEVEEGKDAPETPHMFPGETVNRVMSRGTYNKAWNRAMRRLGLQGLTPHMMRHVAATIYLAKHPGAYEVVAALLGDSVRTVEKFYARGEGRAAMEMFAEVLAELNPNLVLQKRKT